MRTSLLLCTLAVLSACGGLPRVSMDPAFHGLIRRVAILPFETRDDSSHSRNQVITDQLTESLMERGLRVVDGMALRAEASKQGITLDSNVTSDNVARLCQALKLDGAFVGRTVYHFDGPSTESVYEGRYDVINAIGEVFVAIIEACLGGHRDAPETTTSSETIPGSRASTGGYRLHEAHAYYVEAVHGDTVLDAHADASTVSDMMSKITSTIK